MGNPRWMPLDAGAACLLSFVDLSEGHGALLCRLLVLLLDWNAMEDSDACAYDSLARCVARARSF